MNTSQLNVSTCVSFLSSELPITPDALKYEMFRFFGIPVTTEERAHASFLWNYRAVIDCNVYFFLLKYLIKRDRKLLECCDPFESLICLSDGQHVRHRDVAYNLLAWIYLSEFLTPKAVLNLTFSWSIMNSLDLCHVISTTDMKRKQYQFNAAKLHALVALYNTWFARKSSSVKYCFHCLLSSEQLLNAIFKKCSNCKISTYCSINAKQRTGRFIRWFVES